jgi:hypothetical protein
MIFSAAAFVIEHPKQERDHVATHLAGFQGALRAYEIIVKTKPEAKLASLGQLLQHRDNGTLRDHIAGLVKGASDTP